MFQQLCVGQIIDFFKVEHVEIGNLLRLRVEMKLPGKAWLEFSIEGNRLIQTAHYYPHGLWGRLYWYATNPFHNLVFQDLAEKIVKQARQEG